MSNADLIERLRTSDGDFGLTMDEAADALELADKRIAELEAELQQRARQIGIACMKHDLTHSLACGRCLAEAERKLAVAREALQKISMFQCGTPVLTYQGMEIMAREALAQIGGDDAT